MFIVEYIYMNIYHIYLCEMNTDTLSSSTTINKYMMIYSIVITLYILVVDIVLLIIVELLCRYFIIGVINMMVTNINYDIDDVLIYDTSNLISSIITFIISINKYSSILQYNHHHQHQQSCNNNYTCIIFISVFVMMMISIIIYHDDISLSSLMIWRCVCTAVTEELIFRVILCGIIINRIKSIFHIINYNNYTCIITSIISSIIFTMRHLNNIMYNYNYDGDGDYMMIVIIKCGVVFAAGLSFSSYWCHYHFTEKHKSLNLFISLVFIHFTHNMIVITCINNNNNDHDHDHVMNQYNCNGDIIIMMIYLFWFYITTSTNYK